MAGKESIRSFLSVLRPAYVETVLTELFDNIACDDTEAVASLSSNRWKILFKKIALPEGQQKKLIDAVNKLRLRASLPYFLVETTMSESKKKNNTLTFFKIRLCIAKSANPNPSSSVLISCGNGDNDTYTEKINNCESAKMSAPKNEEKEKEGESVKDTNTGKANQLKNRIEMRKPRRYQMENIRSVAQDLVCNMKKEGVFAIFKRQDEIWTDSEFLGVILDGSIQKATALASDLQSCDLIFLLSIPQNILETMYDVTADDCVYYPFFSRLSTIVKERAQQAPFGGFHIKHDCGRRQAPYMSIVWKHVHFNIFVAFHCPLFWKDNSHELWKVNIWEDQIPENLIQDFNRDTVNSAYLSLMKKINGADKGTKRLFLSNLSLWNSVLSINYVKKLPSMCRDVVVLLKKMWEEKKRGKQFIQLPKSYSLEIIAACAYNSKPRQVFVDDTAITAKKQMEFDGNSEQVLAKNLINDLKLVYPTKKYLLLIHLFHQVM
ncbi:hypothetical protein RFI_20635 [Reticulomyxa filosa]|uniref:Uncharacterized protein n=1 Tax=Reticulomyxa filosa TaxID=46433 RepID=X6MS82_RETFI|nr:hypothetical protein RFI_20635 [Reticulomyxa filosa]|eukprot:ETO16704.1 hypothetical protein RFI_20635 [Reticulomyxa filosa]